MMRLQPVGGPVFGMAFVALDSPACMLCSADLLQLLHASSTVLRQLHPTKLSQ